MRDFLDNWLRHLLDSLQALPRLFASPDASRLAAQSDKNVDKRKILRNILLSSLSLIAFLVYGY